MKRHYNFYSEQARTFGPLSLLDEIESEFGWFCLSIRARGCLREANITTIGQLVSKSEKELLGIPNLGRKTLNEIKDVLYAFGYKFKQ